VPIVEAWRAPPPPLAQTAPLPMPHTRRLHLRCFEMQEEQQQSLKDCVFRLGPIHPTLMQPGDYPLRGLRGAMIAGVPGSPRAL
jgi:hypothetical protein